MAVALTSYVAFMSSSSPKTSLLLPKMKSLNSNSFLTLLWATVIAEEAPAIGIFYMIRL